jgi:TRAP-type C4-dicarboxylate transport system substrate-binding protein
VAKFVTDLNFAQIVSVNVINEAWFQKQPKDVQEAIRAAGRSAEQQAFPWGVNNVQKTNELWLANKGEILKLPPQEQASMMQTFVSIGTNIVAQNPVVKAEMVSGACRRSNEVTSDPVGPLLTSYVERLEYSCEAALCLRVLAGPAPCLRST